MSEDNRTLAELASEALLIQDACNLSGLCFGWARSMQRLCDLLRDQGGTDFRNHHPINVLWSSKIASLTRSEDTSTVFKAFDACELLAKGVPA